jgi:hypothetical protein
MIIVSIETFGIHRLVMYWIRPLKRHHIRPVKVDATRIKPGIMPFLVVLEQILYQIHSLFFLYLMVFRINIMIVIIKLLSSSSSSSIVRLYLILYLLLLTMTVGVLYDVPFLYFSLVHGRYIFIQFIFFFRPISLSRLFRWMMIHSHHHHISG